MAEDQGQKVQEIIKPLADFARIFRYLFPGIVFFVELVFWFYLFQRNDELRWFKTAFWPLTVEKSTAALSMLIVIGFLLSTGYHPLLVLFTKYFHSSAPRAPNGWCRNIINRTTLASGFIPGLIIGGTTGWTLLCLVGAIAGFLLGVAVGFILSFYRGKVLASSFQDVFFLPDYRLDVSRLIREGLVSLTYVSNDGTSQNCDPS